ncbi:hypothetical protein IW261DRAFT_969550 [Armillaria novae-zelandiae]|uniref:CCHC-type domain-containing protein n=1 Tax=Armillaria novae-zelandiae TaxID=153914 RepID=A0AA39PGW7_9AGAR|nr:hypothetical protein IW261DRAFT_969550 [Armillaria novae-zelandiae]
MTRVTNFGRKRTYLEAGFTTTLAETADPADLAMVDEPTTENAPPTKKKRSKHSTTGFDDRNDINLKQAKTKASRAAASEHRRQQRIAERDALTTCFACRERGHAARNCPKTKIQDANGKTQRNVVGICYRCGSTKHTLSRCKKPSDPSNPLPFAACFVCSGQGHLASACPQNKEKGVYPNGGCCKICRDTSHLAKDCELRKKDLTHNPSVFVVDEDVGAGADEDGFHVFKRKHYEVEQDEKAARRQAVSQNPPVRKKKVVHF